MPINTTAIKNELTPGLRLVQGKYKDIPNRWNMMGFQKGTSKMAVERTTQMRFLSLAREKAEGASVHFDNEAGERAVYNQEHREIGLAYTVTRKAIDDNLYKTQFNLSNLGLQRSFAQTKEIYAANVFNVGTTFDSSIGGDGVALFSTAHPLDGSTVGNRPAVDVDLNEASLLAAMVAIRTNWVDQAGLRISARGMTLVIPPALEPIAIRLLQSELRPGTGNNDVNAIRSMNGGLTKYVVNEYLTNPNAWYLLTDQEGLIFLQRVPFEMDMYVDFDTDNLKVKGYERYSFGYTDWRAVYGSFPSA